MGLMNRLKLKRSTSEITQTTEIIKQSIFIVSDDQITSAALQNTLKEGGYAVVWAQNIDEAIKLLVEMEILPHAVIGDFLHPEVDAKAFLSRARVRLGQGRLPPVMLLMDSPEDESTAHAMRVNDLLPKPIDNERLLRSLSEMIAKRGAA